MSAISYSKSRPLSPLVLDNAYNLSKAGYANPGNLDRAYPSAVKSKRNNQPVFQQQKIDNQF